MTDIHSVLRDLNVTAADQSHHHTTSGWVNVDCPRCSPGSEKYRLGIPLNGQVSHCWLCGKLNLVQVLSELSGQPVNVVIGLLRGLWSGSHRDKSVKPTTGGKLVRPVGVEKMNHRHRLYLEDRGIDPDYAEEVWKVQGTGQLSDKPWRLYLPIFLNGKEVSWTTRSIGTMGTPYLSARPDQEVIRHRELLYGEHLCGSSVVVVEGPLDAIVVGAGCVATMGIGYSDEQAGRIARYPVRAICFDNEPDAQRRARRLVRDLLPFPGETHNVVLETGKDTIRADKSEVEELKRRFLV